MPPVAWAPGALGAGDAHGRDWLGAFFLPALAGHITGGVTLMAALAHGQFIAASVEGEEHVAVSE